LSSVPNRGGLRRRALQGALWTSGTTALLVPVQVAQLALLGRLLGVDGFGRYALLQTVAVTAIGLSDLGVSDALSRRGARAASGRHSRAISGAARQVATWYLLRLWVPLVPLALLMEPATACLYAVALLVNALSMSAAATLTMSSDYRAASLIKTLGTLVAVGATVAAASYRADPELVLVAGALAGNVVSLLLLRALPAGERLRHLLPQLPRLTRADVRIGLGVFSLTQLEQYVFGRTELFFFSDSQAAARGGYAAGQSVAARSTLLLDALFGPLPIALAEAHASGAEAWQRAARQVLTVTSRVIRAAAAPLLALSISVPPLLFGSQYDHALAVTEVLTAVSLLQTTALPHGALRFALGSYASAVPIGIGAVLLDVLLCLTLVPRYGAAGAAAAATASGTVYVTCNAVWLHRAAPGLGVLRHYVRTALVIAVAALVALLLLQLPLVPRVACALALAVVAVAPVLFRGGLRGVRQQLLAVD